MFLILIRKISSPDSLITSANRIIRIDEHGDTLWTKSISDTSRDRSYSVRETSDGGFIVAGTSFSDSTTYDIWLTRLDTEVSTEIADQKKIIPEYHLSQNYPNPFNPTTKISWHMRAAGRAIIKVFDIIGNEVETLVDKEFPAGVHEIKFDAAGLSSGIYFYRMNKGSFSVTRKMLLIK